MKTLWIGFCGTKDPTRDFLAAALVRELQTRSVNAHYMELRAPAREFLEAVYEEYADFAKSLQTLFGDAVFRRALERRIAEMKNCAMVVVPDIDSQADAEWIGSLGGMLIGVAGAAIDPAQRPEPALWVCTKDVTSCGEMSRSLTRIMDAIWKEVR